jgi:hypothetical protein
VVAEVRERLAVIEHAALTFDAEIINLRNQSELEVRKQFQIKISNMFAALEKLNDSEVIIRLGKTLKGISKSQLKSLRLYELKQHKLWFDEECLRFLDQRK